MSDAVKRLLNTIKQTNVDTTSNIVSLTVKSKNPLILSGSDRLLLSEEFILFDTYIDTSKIEIGDIFRAISLNYGQLYYIIDIVSSDKELDKYIQRIEALERRFNT